MIDRDLLRKVRAEIDAALAKVAADNGLTLKVGNITFGPNVFTAKVEGAVAGTNRQREEFKQLAPQFGMQVDWLDKTFDFGGKRFTLTGVTPYGCLLGTIAGKPVRYKAEALERFIAKATLAAPM